MMTKQWLERQVDAQRRDAAEQRQRADELAARMAELESAVRTGTSHGEEAGAVVGPGCAPDAEPAAPAAILLAQERAAHAATRERMAELETLVRAAHVEVVVERERCAAMVRDLVRGWDLQQSPYAQVELLWALADRLAAAPPEGEK